MNKPARYAASILLVFGGLILFFSFSILKAKDYTIVAAPMLLALTAIAFVLIGALLGFEKMHPKKFFILERVANYFRIRLDQLAMLNVAVILSIIVRYAAGYENMMALPIVASFAWIAALTLAIAGGWKSNEAGKIPSKASWRMRLDVPFSLAVVFTVAFIPRIIFPESIPVFLSGDEGSAGIAATQFASGTFNNLFILGWYSFPSLYFAIPAAFIRALGPTVTALRLSSAFPGALTVVALFWIARSAYGKRVAWFSAIFLATLHFHVHFSRIALNNIWDGLWITVSLGALWYGWNHERRNAYVLAGFILGFCQYFYTSGHTLPFIMLAWIAIVGFFDRSRLKRALPDLWILFWVGLIVAGPLILFYLKYPNELLAPMSRVSILNSDWLKVTMEAQGLPAWRVWLNQLWQGFGAYVYAPLRNWYIPEIPILRPSAAVFFVLGLIFVLLHDKKKIGWILLLWLCAFAIQGALSESAPASQRYVASAPAVALFVAVGISDLSSLFEKIWFPIRKLAFASSVVCILLLAGRELFFYFWEYTYAAYWNTAQSNGMVGYQLGLYLRSHYSNADIVFLGAKRMGFRSIPSVQYLAPQFNGIDINAPWGSPDNPIIENKDLLFIILPEAEEEIPLIQKDFPNGALSPKYAVNGKILFYIYEYRPH